MPKKDLEEELKSIEKKIISKGGLPKHVAVIMDGNGRWARKRGLPRIAGHRAGIEAVREVVKGCIALGIPYLTLYTFSVENWNRPRQEVNALMAFLRQTLRKEVNELDRRDVRLLAIGRIDDLPSSVRDELKRAMKKLSDNKGLTLILALSYGGRVEIVDAIRKIARMVARGKLDPDEIDVATVDANLYTAGIPDPDLLIRTSGEMRVSNFLLWQIAYSEIWVTDVLWPDFRRSHFYQAIIDYQGRERRFGRISPVK